VLPFKGDRGDFVREKRERGRVRINRLTFTFCIFLKKEEEREEEGTVKTRYNDAGYNDILR